MPIAISTERTVLRACGAKVQPTELARGDCRRVEGRPARAGRRQCNFHGSPRLAEVLLERTRLVRLRWFEPEEGKRGGIAVMAKGSDGCIQRYFASCPYVASAQGGVVADVTYSLPMCSKHAETAGGVIFCATLRCVTIQGKSVRPVKSMRD